MNKPFLIVFFLFISIVKFNFAQWTMIDSIKINCTDFQTDEFDNIYFSNDGELNKTNKSGSDNYTYKNAYLGDLHNFDITDPLKILLFYKDFNQICFLDRKLTELRAPIDLYDLDINVASAVCSSKQGGFWVYDESLNKLIKFDNNLKKTQESFVNLRLISNDFSNLHLLEDTYFLVLGNGKNGIVIFDTFGSYKLKLNNCRYSQIQVDKNSIITLYENKINIYNILSKENQDIEIPINNIDNFWVKDNKWYFKKGKSIWLFIKDEKKF